MLVGTYFHASKALETVLVCAAGIVGVLGGLGINFALGPVYVRRMFPVSKLEDSRLVDSIEKCFARASLQSPSFHVIEIQREAVGNAMIAGFRWGRGFFRPGLFISRGTIEQLSSEELEAVVLHEVSHVALRHLARRLAYSVGIVLAIATIGSFCLMLLHTLAGQGNSGIFGPALAVVAFLLGFQLLNRQNRFHEFEADIHSIEKLGSSPEHLARALQKIGGRGAPTEMRVKAIALYFKAKRAKVGEEASSSDDHFDKAA
jgi:Zn-dependent protease with chaperone function